MDTASGPAVFYSLGALRKGDRIAVDRADGRTAAFAVDAVAVYERSAFPSRTVYQGTGGAQLRLITCGGGYSRSRGYLGNVVVYAHLLSG